MDMIIRGQNHLRRWQVDQPPLFKEQRPLKMISSSFNTETNPLDKYHGCKYQVFGMKQCVFCWIHGLHPTQGRALLNWKPKTKPRYRFFGFGFNVSICDLRVLAFTSVLGANQTEESRNRCFPLLKIKKPHLASLPILFSWQLLSPSSWPVLLSQRRQVGVRSHGVGRRSSSRPQWWGMPVRGQGMAPW